MNKVVLETDKYIKAVMNAVDGFSNEMPALSSDVDLNTVRFAIEVKNACSFNRIAAALERG